MHNRLIILAVLRHPTGRSNGDVHATRTERQAISEKIAKHRPRILQCIVGVVSRSVMMHTAVTAWPP